MANQPRTSEFTLGYLEVNEKNTVMRPKPLSTLLSSPGTSITKNLKSRVYNYP